MFFVHNFGFGPEDLFSDLLDQVEAELESMGNDLDEIALSADVPDQVWDIIQDITRRAADHAGYRKQPGGRPTYIHEDTAQCLDIRRDVRSRRGNLPIRSLKRPDKAEAKS